MPKAKVTGVVDTAVVRGRDRLSSSARGVERDGESGDCAILQEGQEERF